MPDLPTARIHHVTPHRLRLRIPERRRDAAFFEQVRSRLSEWSSVDGVEVNPVTASVLVRFADPMALAIDNASRNDLFALGDFDPGMATGEMRWDGSPLVEQARRGMASVDSGLRRLSGGQAGLRSWILLGLVGTGIVQALRGNMAAPAVTLFWYAGDVLGLWRGVPERPASGTDDRA